MNLWELLGNLYKVIKSIPVVAGTIQMLIIQMEGTDKPGEEKKKAVVDSVVKAFKDNFNIDLSSYRPALEFLVDISVSAYNLVKFFTHKK